MDRRSFLRRLGAAGLSGVAGAILAACGGGPKAAVKRKAVVGEREPVLQLTDRLVTADWVREENARSDRTRAWIIPRQSESSEIGIEGFVNQTSFVAGDELELRVSTKAGSFRAFVYRMGYYGGFGARSVAASDELVGRIQALPTLDRSTNTVECDWRPSWSVSVPKEWPTGAYLIKLVASSGPDQYVPFTVRDDHSRAAYLVQSSVTTWQAYNPYGGYSLYGGVPSGGESDFQARARVVSFDRPYSHSNLALDARGSGDFLGNELPFVYLAERHGLDVTYITDVDLHARPQQLDAHRCFVSLGHDEYWSAQMRDGAENALDAGVNLAFLGANACYRQIRLEPSALGANRRVICYKDASEDPILTRDPAFATGGSWATDPIPRPESSLIGLMYQSYGAPFVPLVVTDGSSWIYKGTGLRTGDSVPAVIGSEFDGFDPAYPYPGGVEILAHSPTTSASGRRYADLAYYSVAGKGSVFATGTADWVSSIWNAPPPIQRRLGFGVKFDTVDPLTTVTLNVLAAFGPGPAAERHPSTSTWHRFYTPSTHPRPSKDV